jgi:hypothetical protein
VPESGRSVGTPRPKHLCKKPERSSQSIGFRIEMLANPSPCVVDRLCAAPKGNSQHARKLFRKSTQIRANPRSPGRISADIAELISVYLVDFIH